jgi:predicted DNA-binding transcriptional regulator YafY
MNIELIKKAIGEKRLLRFNYDNAQRIVEPHAVGYDNKNQLKMRAYQVGGFSSSGTIPDWRIYKVDEMSMVEVLDQFFESARPGYNYLGDKAIPQMVSKI